jgi:hypothetical protein
LQIKSQLAALLTVLALACVAASGAFAGESTGNGQSLKQDDGTLHGASACAFSGQNPEGLLDPSSPDYEPGRVQNWGHIPKTGEGFTREFAYANGLNPGIACNPTKSQGE